ncbi:MAG: hypothetical protein GQF41_4600 [Candidatus Rifleibacterium amylolyticum]|nr:MAG: hypothetical protein GQF41_4600 [Candidatus Rifleibacterium amylolyticum]
MDMRKKLELFEVIRRDFQQGGHSIRSIASKYQIHRRMVRQALASTIPPERKVCIRPAHKLGDFENSELINKSQNNRVDAEKPAGSRVLLAQHLRPSRFSGHDCRSMKR